MKKFSTLALTLLGFVSYTNAQNQQENVDAIITHDQCTKFVKTPPLRDLIKTLPPTNEEEVFEFVPPKDRRIKHDTIGFFDVANPTTNSIDPIIQTSQGYRPGKGGTKANWSGLSGSGAPPDPTGAAGPDHYVQAINSSYRVYNKDGSFASPALSLTSLWTGSSSDGDPIVMYDRFADRWFISQFQTLSSEILLAVSETSDPLGAYFLYSFTFTYSSAWDEFPDYPKFGVWSNAYFMTSNTGNNDCIAFERDKMLLGDPTASKINMSFPSFTQFFNSVAPSYAEGPTLPDLDEPCYFFAVQEDAWSGVTTDNIKILKATINWTSPGTSSVTTHQTLYPASFNSDFSSGSAWSDIVQQGPVGTPKLDPVSGIFMYRAQYRRFDGYNVVMLCHTVNVGSNRAGVRWYELRDANDGVWSIYQQGTYSPDSQNSRWLGNIAMDQQGNIAMAYSFAGSGNYAGIRYTGRFKDDPLGTMTVQEQVAVDGLSSQTVSNRYGDYSQMTMDPTDDMTFWFTGEYIGTGGQRRTRIFSFSSWHLTGQEEIINPVPFFNAYQPSPEIVRVIWNDLKDEKVTATITTIEGKIIATSQINTQNTQEDFDISVFASGIYFVTLTGDNTNLSKKIYVAR